LAFLGQGGEESFMGVVFRESYPNLHDLIDKGFRLYSGYPHFREYNKTEKIWRFPTNAKELGDPANIEAVAHKLIEPIYTDGQCAQLLFRHMANDDVVHDFQSFEFSFIAFDESTHHSEFQIQTDMRMVVSRKELDIQHWWPHFTGTDYGFTISAAASYLFVRVPKNEDFPKGRIYVLDEVVREGILAEDLAALLLQRWFLEERLPGRWIVPEKPRAIMMWALSPDAWAKSGVKGEQDVPLTRADQMNAVLSPYRMGFVQANNDRQGGWQHMFGLLRSGELVICDNCKLLIEAIPTRIHDADKEDDIRKDKGSPLDDCVDALRYGLYTWIREPVKPVDLQRAEVMQGLSPTNAMIARAKFESQQVRSNAPVFIGPGAARRQRQWEMALRHRRR
jgi:hypothetical protein